MEPPERSAALGDQVSRPALADVIERNIRTVASQHLETRRGRGVSDRIADTITTFSGRMSFVYVHVAWFAAWILANTGQLGVRAFDPFPYGLLTMIVSLEAIFLSTFVLISQNRLSEDADRRAHLALQIGLLTEHELTRALQMLDAVQDKLGIENDSDIELAQLEMETRPEDVLDEIRRIEQEVRSSLRHARLPRA